jgi:hypothetical protein
MEKNVDILNKLTTFMTCGMNAVPLKVSQNL